MSSVHVAMRAPKLIAALSEKLTCWVDRAGARSVFEHEHDVPEGCVVLHSPVDGS